MIYGVSPRVLVCCVMDYCLSLHNSAETSEERQASTPLSWIFTLLACEALNAFSFSPLTVTHPQQATKISRAVGNLRLAIPLTDCLPLDEENKRIKDIVYFNYFDSERKRKDFRERNVINGIVFIFLEKNENSFII